MFSTKLREMYSVMTYSEMKVADFLLENKKNATSLTSEKVAKLTDTSKSTISRLTKKLGYTSFKNILLDIQNEVDDTENLTIRKNDTNSQTCEKLKLGFQNALIQSIASLNYQDIDKSVEMLNKANKIVCYGAHTSQVIAHYLSNKLQEIGIDAVCQNDLYNLTSIMMTMTKNDVAVVVSHSGATFSSKRIAKIAKDRGIFLIAITGMDGGNVRKMADVALTSHVSGTNRTMAYATTKCSQLFLVDVLYINLYRQDEEKYDKNAEKMYKELSEELGRGDYKKAKKKEV